MNPVFISLGILFLTSNSWAQHTLTATTDRNVPGTGSATGPAEKKQAVRITGVRFAYPLVQQWIRGRP